MNEQFVPESVNRFDFERRAGIVQFFTDIFHLSVDKVEIVYLIDMVTPHGFGKGFFTDQVVGTIDEVR